MRRTQALFEPSELRLVRYVDDPLAAIRGTPSERRLYVAITVLVWVAIGFTLAYAKGQISRTVAWIGGMITVDANGVKATVKESITEDILLDLARSLATNIVSKKELHSLLVKLSHAAHLLIVMRPFLDRLASLGHTRLSWPQGVCMD